MKSMKLPKIRNFFALLAVLVVLPCSVRADDGLPIVSYQVRPNAFVSSDFCTRLQALPEWGPFFASATELLDQSLTRELDRDRLTGKLPDPMVDDIRKAVDKGISTRKAVEAFFEHTDLIVFELQADIGSFEFDADSVTKLLRSGKIDVKIDIDGVLGTVVDVNPRRLLGVLKYLEEGKDYEFLKNDNDGDFVIKFNFRFHDHKIGFCCAGIKIQDSGLNSGKFALLFSGKHDIDGYVKRFKDGKYVTVAGSPVKEVVFAEPCFLFLDNQRKKVGMHSNEADFLGKIKQLKGSFRDVDGVSRVDLVATMATPEDAKAVRDLLGGLTALVHLTQGNDSQAAKLLESIKINVEGNTITVSAKLDNPELWKVIAFGLDKATEEIKKKSR